MNPPVPSELLSVPWGFDGLCLQATSRVYAKGRRVYFPRYSGINDRPFFTTGLPWKIFRTRSPSK